MSASLPIYDIRGSKIHKYMSASQADYEIRWLHLPKILGLKPRPSLDGFLFWFMLR
jgi:hypothetical protein